MVGLKKMKYKITHNRPDCISCGACAAIDPDTWKMDEKDDGKADLIGSKRREDGWEEKEIEEKDLEINKESAEACPVNVIHIKKLETDKEII